jgi:sugar phosphate isomerase/epimerase
MAEDLDKLSINQITTGKQWSLEQAIDGYARAGIGAMAVWADKLRAFGVEAGARRLRDAGMSVSGYCVGGPLTGRSEAERSAEIDDHKRMLDEAAAIGARCLVTIGGGLPEGDRDLPAARARALEGVGALLPHARDTGVTIALEPLHPMVCAGRSLLVSLRQANDWCDALGAGPELGIAVDTYNVWWDPELETQVERAAGRIVAFHVSDWLRETRDLRFDRGMPGDGILDLARLRRLVEATGYAGHREVEIFSSRNWWLRDPDEVVAVVKARYLTHV